MTDKERLEKALFRVVEARTLVKDVNDGREPPIATLTSCIYQLNTERERLEDLLQLMEIAA